MPTTTSAKIQGEVLLVEQYFPLDLSCNGSAFDLSKRFEL
jgi:hypothetical protein